MSTSRDAWTADTRNATPLSRRLPQLLRLAGATALLVAMYSFLVQGWQGSSDLLRYGLLLGHSLLLCGAGLASGHWLQEPRGARLLTSLALVSVPANFAILGAFVHAEAGIAALNYPGIATWQLGAPGLTAAVVGGSALLLLPVVILGFRVLARPLSSRLSWQYLAGNAVLLIPLRDPTAVAGLTLPLALWMLWRAERSRDQHLCARTPDGILARLLQFLPLGVLLGRSLWLYDADAFLFTAGLLCLFLAARQLSLLLPGQSILRGFLEVGSGLLTPLIGIGVAVLLERLLPDPLLLPAGSLACAALLLELSRRVEMAPALYRVLAVPALLLGFSGNLLLFDSLANALLCLVAGLLLTLAGHYLRRLALLGAGLVIAASGLVYLFGRLLSAFDLGGWISLALVGLAAILLGSLLESRASDRFTRLKQRFAHWQV
ncbi:hypothetical protein GCM10011348_44770 [Marinobacterium nitratireducens]|uniref:DUF2157 domain-containing protein n=1 Tax=Marinobacterium nitratireducens TaxID=518897 RepID=A0A917ZQF8_9GAMM|nr:hypothetical protein [Marinobacterium nitratireducens]GGO88702.1 hypothetical protein GCM10011348_44770 [Marinobacterium nitratireducens]